MKSDTEIVFTNTHPFADSVGHESVALSCKGPIQNEFGGAGFEQSEETKSLRGDMLIGSFTLVGDDLRLWADTEIFFSSELLKLGRMWRLFLKPKRSFDWDTDRCKKIGLELSAVSKAFAGDRFSKEMLDGFHQISSNNNCSVLYWPFDTEHPLICIAFSADLLEELQNLNELAKRHKMSIREVDWHEMPNY